MIQIISLVGSLAILAAFIANQARRLTSTGVSYLVLNTFGSAILAVIAIVEHQWGFLLLEGTWAFVSLWSLLRLLLASSQSASQ
ncbi:MAG: hypothetical protein H0X24_17285 [Ktedonobacterales bacterium]|nr:hypothetical protein [Ktedonobacterales bacterium]